MPSRPDGVGQGPYVHTLTIARPGSAKKQKEDHMTSRELSPSDRSALDANTQRLRRTLRRFQSSAANTNQLLDAAIKCGYRIGDGDMEAWSEALLSSAKPTA